MQQPFRSVAILGPGLIGGSIALAARKYLPNCEVRIWARREAPLVRAREFGIAAVADTDLCSIVNGAELVILATPVSTFLPLAQKFLPALAPGAIITDVGSVKGSVHQTVGHFLTEHGHCFIGSHPMAGAEKQGLENAREDLFCSATVVLTQQEQSNTSAVARLRDFWTSIGAGEIIIMEKDAHDCAVGRTSHLPHLLAALCARNVSCGGVSTAELSKLAATGFRDTTRVSSGGAELWTDIILSNKEVLKEALKDCRDDLEDLLQIIDRGEADLLCAWLEKARKNRQDLCND